MEVLDPLRGIAALSVVLFHYSGSILPTIAPCLLTGTFSRGDLGVQVFFVISGFVIPYSLHRTGYGLGSLPSFMLRRWVRIAPPAYCAAGLVVLYHGLSWLLLERPVTGAGIPDPSAAAILSNLTFTAEYTGTGWYNFVYWTLAAEFEFYLLLGLIFPLLVDPERPWSRSVLLVAMSLLPLFATQVMLFRYAIFFVFGILVFLNRERIIDRGSTLMLAVPACIVGLAIGQVLATAVGLGTALVIHFAPRVRLRPLAWLGLISFSLYITHAPVGWFAESLMKRVTDLHGSEAGKLLLLLFYAVVAILAAWGFHRAVELPFLRLSQRVGRRALVGPKNAPASTK